MHDGGLFLGQRAPNASRILGRFGAERFAQARIFITDYTNQKGDKNPIEPQGSLFKPDHVHAKPIVRALSLKREQSNLFLTTIARFGFF